MKNWFRFPNGLWLDLDLIMGFKADHKFDNEMEWVVEAWYPSQTCFVVSKDFNTKEEAQKELDKLMDKIRLIYYKPMWP